MDYYKTKMEMYDDPMDVVRNTNVEKFNVDYTPEECIEDLYKDLEKVTDIVITAGFKEMLKLQQLVQTRKST